MLETDPRKITVVLRNLVGNALKFTERGFVQLEADVTPDGVVLRVQDTGIGIRHEDHERVFDMFRQADGSDTRRFGGTGLGLYIVRRFVRQLGGDVTLTSEPGRGSTCSRSRCRERRRSPTRRSSSRQAAVRTRPGGRRRGPVKRDSEPERSAALGLFRSKLRGATSEQERRGPPVVARRAPFRIRTRRRCSCLGPRARCR
jgi:anti-sigma regulatory factor (Ser/Thr protein kinase)